jgi:DNA processing protein
MATGPAPQARPAVPDGADQDPCAPASAPQRVAQPASEWPTDQDFRREFFACLALRHTPGIGRRTAKTLVSAYPTAYDAVRDAASWKAKGLVSARQAGVFRSESWRPAAEREFREARDVNLRLLLFSESLYPARLWDIPDPPLFLYYEGDLGLLSGPCLAVVGSRRCTRAGLSATEEVCAALSRFGVTIVSGLAQGIDRQAHLAGLSGLGRSVAVQATGLHVDYPPQNADLRRTLGRRGLVLTEHPPGTRPLATNFPVRNRIISGLSLGVLVAEAGTRSGSLITARLALEQGREVLALPGAFGQPTFAGCNRLIKDGATLVESAEDVLFSLRDQLKGQLKAMAPEALGASASSGGRDGFRPGAGAAFAGHGGPDSQAEARTDFAEVRDEVRDDARIGGRPVGRSCESCGSEPRDSAQDPAQYLAQDRPGPDASPAAFSPIPPDIAPDSPEGRVLALLASGERLHIDALAEGLDLAAAPASRALLLLEMRGLVRQWPGMYYGRA